MYLVVLIPVFCLYFAYFYAHTSQYAIIVQVYFIMYSMNLSTKDEVFKYDFLLFTVGFALALVHRTTNMCIYRTEIHQEYI